MQTTKKLWAVVTEWRTPVISGSVCWDRQKFSLRLQLANGNHYLWLEGLAAQRKAECLCGWHTGLPTSSQMEFVIKQSSRRIIKASVLSISTRITVKFQHCFWQEFIIIYSKLSDALCSCLIPIVQTVMSTCQDLIRSENKIIRSGLFLSCRAFHAALPLSLVVLHRPHLCVSSPLTPPPPLSLWCSLSASLLPLQVWPPHTTPDTLVIPDYRVVEEGLHTKQ